MPNFSYRARGRDGREIRGTLQAENEASAVSRIRESYPILLSITPLNEKKSLSGLMSMEIGSKRFKTKTLAILFPSLRSRSGPECRSPGRCGCSPGRVGIRD